MASPRRESGVCLLAPLSTRILQGTVVQCFSTYHCNFEQVFTCGFGLYLNNIWPCQSSLLIYQCRGPCSMLYHFLWDLWCTKAQGRGVLQVHQFFSVSIMLEHTTIGCHPATTTMTSTIYMTFIKTFPSSCVPCDNTLTEP